MYLPARKALEGLEVCCTRHSEVAWGIIQWMIVWSIMDNVLDVLYGGCLYREWDFPPFQGLPVELKLRANDYILVLIYRMNQSYELLGNSGFTI